MENKYVYAIFSDSDVLTVADSMDAALCYIYDIIDDHNKWLYDQGIDEERYYIARIGDHYIRIISDDERTTYIVERKSIYSILDEA